MATVVITGGAGFIGSHLVERALAQGHEVHVVDDFSSGRRENLAAVADNPLLHVETANVGELDTLESLIATADVVFHLAATVGVFNVMQHPVATIENNIATTSRVLRAAQQNGVRVLAASSSEVYGKTAAVPFGEEDDLTLGPSSRQRWAYAASKLVDEFLALAYHREFGVPATVVRPFNTIGPRQVGQYGMVVPRLLTQALRGEDLTIFGDGRQTRCFTYVSDVVEWLWRLSERPETAGGVYNLGNPVEVSMNALAARVIAVTGSQSNIVHQPYEQAYGAGHEEMPRRVPDIRKVCEATGYEPQVALEEALRRTCAWLSETLAGGQWNG